MTFTGSSDEIDSLNLLSAEDAIKYLRSCGNVYNNRSEVENLSEPSFYIDRVICDQLQENVDPQRISIIEREDGTIASFYIG